eukprot:2720500-Amphidinium_carterae.1
MAAAPASWANLAESLRWALWRAPMIRVLMPLRCANCVVPMQLSIGVPTLTLHRACTDGSIPLPMFLCQVLAMMSTAKDAVMAAAGLAKERTVELNTVISQTTDGQVELVVDDLVAAVYKPYKTVFGMFAEDNVDRPIEQFTGVHQFITSLLPRSTLLCLSPLLHATQRS